MSEAVTKPCMKPKADPFLYGHQTCLSPYGTSICPLQALLVLLHVVAILGRDFGGYGPHLGGNYVVFCLIQIPLTVETERYIFV